MQIATNSASEDPQRAAARLMSRMHLRDGLPEMLMGMLWLGMAIPNWLFLIAPSSRANRAVVLAVCFTLYLAFTVLGIMAPSILKWIRHRFLVERAGYARSRPEIRKKKQLAWVFAATLLTAPLIGYAVVHWHALTPGGWFPAFLGALFCTAFLFLRPLRFKVYGILILAAGCLLAILGLSITAGIAGFFAFTGMLSLVSGVIVLCRFLRNANKEEAEP